MLMMLIYTILIHRPH